jgi:hypothetical protein
MQELLNARRIPFDTSGDTLSSAQFKAIHVQQYPFDEAPTSTGNHLCSVVGAPPAIPLEASGTRKSLDPSPSYGRRPKKKWNARGALLQAWLRWSLSSIRQPPSTTA